MTTQSVENGKNPGTGEPTAAQKMLRHAYDSQAVLGAIVALTNCDAPAPSIDMLNNLAIMGLESADNVVWGIIDTL